MARKLEGRRRKRGKWQAYVDVGDRQITKTFPLSTPHAAIDAWRAQQMTTHTPRIAAAESLAADVRMYLSRVTAMPTYNQRAAHLELWLQALGRDRRRMSITPTEIDQVLQTWLKDPAPARDADARGRRPAAADGVLSLETVRKRRTSLYSFFEKMKTPDEVNPVAATSLPAPAELGAPRSLNVAAVERAIAHMADERSVKRGAAAIASHAKIVARVMAYTGLPPAMIKKIQPTDFSWAEKTLRVEARRKTGVEARTLPYGHLPDAWRALQAFHAANLYGVDFSVSSVNRAFQKGVRKAGLDPRVVSLYALRHSFLTLLYANHPDEATVARFAMHAKGSPITARYTLGAHETVNRQALMAMKQALIRARRAALRAVPKTRAAVQKTRAILPANPARGRKAS